MRAHKFFKMPIQAGYQLTNPMRTLCTKAPNTMQVLRPKTSLRSVGMGAGTLAWWSQGWGCPLIAALA